MELGQLQEQINLGNVDDRLAVMLVLVQNGSVSTPATMDYLDAYLNKLKLKIPAGIDPDFNLSLYFPGNQVPMQLLVNLDDMSLVYAKAASMAQIGVVIQQYLGAL